MKKIFLFTAVMKLSTFSLNAQMANCSLTRVADSLFSGACHINDSIIFTVQLKPDTTKRLSTLFGTGTMKGRPENMPLFLEVKSDTGVLGTSFFVNSWYKVQNVNLDDKNLEFTYDPKSLSPASAVNLLILGRIKKYYIDSTKWDKNDTRTTGFSNCQPNTRQRTLFCALFYASTEIMGDFYAGPSFQAVIDAINRIRKGAQHPIKAFNNDPKTTFAELHQMLDDAISRMEKEIRAYK